MTFVGQIREDAQRGCLVGKADHAHADQRVGSQSQRLLDRQNLAYVGRLWITDGRAPIGAQDNPHAAQILTKPGSDTGRGQHRVGARSHDVFFQFSVESVTLCILGGLAGVGAGQGVIHLLQETVKDGPTPVYTMLGVVMGFTASVVIGILAGIYPAIKAARMDPIEALRHE